VSEKPSIKNKVILISDNVMINSYFTDPTVLGVELDIAKSDLDFVPTSDDQCVNNIIIIDFGMKGASSFISKLPKFPFRTAVIATSAPSSVPDAVIALKSGAIDYLEWPYSLDSVKDAIRYADALITERASKYNFSKLRELFETLSPRERAVVKGIVEGKQNKAVAAELGLSTRTIEMYRANLM